MKDYIIEVKDGHHHVRMLSDEEMRFKVAAEAVVQFIQNLFDTVIEIIENMKEWVRENIDLEKLKELDHEINTRKIQSTIGDTSSIRQPNTYTQHERYENGLVHGTDRMGEHSRTL